MVHPTRFRQRPVPGGAVPGHLGGNREPETPESGEGDADPDPGVREHLQPDVGEPAVHCSAAAAETAEHGHDGLHPALIDWYLSLIQQVSLLSGGQEGQLGQGWHGALLQVAG